MLILCLVSKIVPCRSAILAPILVVMLVMFIPSPVWVIVPVGIQFTKNSMPTYGVRLGCLPTGSVWNAIDRLRFGYQLTGSLSDTNRRALFRIPTDGLRFRYQATPKWPILGSKMVKNGLAPCLAPKMIPHPSGKYTWHIWHWACFDPLSASRSRTCTLFGSHLGLFRAIPGASGCSPKKATFGPQKCKK